MKGRPRTRIRILDSAAKVLRTRGYAGTKLDEIAQLTGVLAPSLYYHFESKDQLVETVMVEGVYRNSRHIMSHVEVLGPGASELQRLEAAIKAHVVFLATGDDYSSAVARVFEELPEGMKQRVLAAYSSFHSYWRDLILAVQNSGGGRVSLDPTVTRKFLIAMLDSCGSWYREGKLSPEQIAQMACDIFLNGFATPQRNGRSGATAEASIAG
jgi:AcrR family transcriptional regulator